MRQIETLVPELRLRTLLASDAGAYHSLVQANAKHLTRFGDYQDEVAASEREIAAALADEQSPPLRYGIVLASELIGRVDLVPVEPPKYGLGFWLSQPVTGRGYATAAVAALITHAARSLGATEVFAGVTHGNDKSVALLQRVGFEAVANFDDYRRYHLSLTKTRG
ncbi:MAG: GNAT family N-acetyltransferase [Actinomycetota bacterium]|nr:GNAT family N-acetyltransferase [Actinomycetota bacterium]